MDQICQTVMMIVKIMIVDKMMLPIKVSPNRKQATEKEHASPEGATNISICPSAKATTKL
jgi:hypothetical protein